MGRTGGAPASGPRRASLVVAPGDEGRLDRFVAARLEISRTRVQALVPAGAPVLANPHGTAPGLAMEVRPNPFRGDGRPSWLIMLPGPPRELRPMFADSVVPLLRGVLPLEGRLVCRTLRTTGIGESVVQEKIGGPAVTALELFPGRTVFLVFKAESLRRLA